MNNNSYFIRNKEIVDQMIEKENTFQYQDEYKNNKISEVALFKYSPSFEMEYCIFDLIKEKREVKRYDPLSFLVTKKDLLPELWGVVNDFASGDDIITPRERSIEERDVDTTLIVINKMDDHVWKDLYKNYYKNEGLKVTFPASVKQIDSIMKDNFKKANNYDAIVVRSDAWEKMATEDNGYKGYDRNVEFRFNRVVFALRPNENVEECGMYCPYANFTWCDNSPKLDEDNPYEAIWNPYLPRSYRRVLPWNSAYYTGSYYTEFLENALSVVVKQSNSFNNIHRYNKEHYKFNQMYTYFDTEFDGKSSSVYIRRKLENDPTKKILLVHAYDTINNRYVKETEKHDRLFRNGRMKIKYKTVLNNTRFYCKKALQSNVQVVVVCAKELYRKDLNCNIFDEVIFCSYTNDYDVPIDFIEKCFPFRREGICKKIDVTFIKPERFFNSNVYCLKSYFQGQMEKQLGINII